MNKAAIKNFAVWARRKLIEDVAQKAYEVGITESDIREPQIISSDSMIINNRTLNKAEIMQRKSLIHRIKEKGFDNIIEEVAFTWFNRFIALRYMEINEYLPSGVRVLSSIELGKGEPDIIKEALNIDLDIDSELVYRLQDAHDTEELYRYLLVRQCNALNGILPGIFEEIEDYTELLLPSNLLGEGSVIRELVLVIPEEDYKEHVEIIGWMYQYYISEKKDAIFEGLKKNAKVTKEDIPAATQLFTPDWIVKYMVENSLGRLWLEAHPNEELKQGWEYYIDGAESKGSSEVTILRPEDIKVLDPAMGSGHILVYAFDVLYEIYKSEGYSERDIPKLILENNLYGLDIDDRAAQLAYFAVMMKARSKNRRIFKDKINHNICVITESNGFSKAAIDYLVDSKADEAVRLTLREDIEYLINTFFDAKEYGSILEIRPINFDLIERRLKEIESGGSENLLELQYKNVVMNKMPTLIKQAKILSQKYDVVCANPPYSGFRKLDEKLKAFIENKYSDYKYDLFSVFMVRNIRFTKLKGLIGLMTPNVWQFISSYDNLRALIIQNYSVVSLVQLEDDGFKDASVSISTFILRNMKVNSKSAFIRLEDVKDDLSQSDKLQYVLKKGKDYIYNINTEAFDRLPNKNFAFWVKESTLDTFIKGSRLGDMGKPRQGMATSDNERFLRQWYEVDKENIAFNKRKDEVIEQKWVPYNKGGGFRKWYGNNEFVINWENNGQEVKEYAKKLYGSYSRSIKNEEFYFQEGITYSFIGKDIGPRFTEEGFVFDVAGSTIFLEDKEMQIYILGLLASKLSKHYMNILNPTINIQVGDIKNIPVIFTDNEELKSRINYIVSRSIEIAKNDWDSFEISWNFRIHPIIEYKGDSRTIEEAFNKWSKFKDDQFNELKAYEEELNRIFIEIYNLHDQLTEELDDKDITISKADREKDIKSFISYAVGCIFGRYSIDGGLLPDMGNILPITDDEYFEDDIVTGFITFLKAVFGEETLVENLDYIADTIGRKSSETSRQTIRRYFLKDFYKEHVQMYNRRPIYWLFDSGKQDGFKALIYMHRYDEYTVAKVRTDYLHKLQKSYEEEIKRLNMTIDADISEIERANAKKKKEKVLKQMEECLHYDQIAAHAANWRLAIDLDDGVRKNYSKFQGIELSQGEGRKPIKADLLAKV